MGEIGHMRRLNDIMQGSYEIEKYIVFQKSICKVCCLDLLELSQMSAVQYSSAIQWYIALHSAVTGGSKQLWLVRQLQPAGRQSQANLGRKGRLARKAALPAGCMRAGGQAGRQAAAEYGADPQGYQEAIRDFFT